MKFVPWLLAALFLFAAVGFWANSNKPLQAVGLIDLNRILNESTQAEQLSERLKDKYEQLIGQLQQETELDEEEQAEFERTVYAEYLRYRQELEDQFQAALDRAISEIAAAQDLQLVLDVDLVRYGGKDVSGDVIKRLR